MPRIDIPVTTAPGGYSGASAAVTFTTADTVNFNQFSLTGREVVLIRNNGVGAATWTATSVDDRLGRREDITAESIAAGATRVFGPASAEGWRQTDGKFYLQASSADVSFAVIRLP